MVISILFCLSLCGCADYYDSDYDSDYESESSYTYSSSYSYNNDSDTTYNSFTNKYGSRTTKCAKTGCDNYIASSGDTNCCTVHSNKCLECRCYIDGDATYCISCLSSAASTVKSEKYSGYKSSYSHECYVCGASAYSKYGSYYYCSECLALVKAFSY